MLQRSARHRGPARPEVVAHVVGPGPPEQDFGPVRLRQARLLERASVERRPPALVDVVVDPAATAIEELELAVQPLSVLVLKVRQRERGGGRDVLRRRDGESQQSGTRAGLHQHDAIRGATAKPRHRIGAPDPSDGLDVGEPEVLERGPVVESTEPVPFGRRAVNGVVDRDPIDHKERLARPGERARSAVLERDCAAGRCRGADVETRHLRGERLGDARLGTEAREVEGVAERCESGAVPRRGGRGQVLGDGEVKVLHQRAAGQHNIDRLGEVGDVAIPQGGRERHRLSPHTRRRDQKAVAPLGVRHPLRPELLDAYPHSAQRRATVRDVTRHDHRLLCAGGDRNQHKEYGEPHRADG